MADKNEKLKRVNEINSGLAKDRKTGYCKMIARKDEFAKTVLRWTIVGIAACVFLIMFKLCSYVLSLN
ncbi:hypothetical protein THOM_1144 [Trachipleistophora hominis]|uniref:Uncharacterized protein n=1 Tax=Trachipleistophora hominis TaxID=72359 RepID=L7JWU3_TRAHO|nr:hypothetical protein THOM_1144 [Trachipleistophora hominis]